MPSRTRCGSLSRTLRSMNAPGSPSSALQMTYFWSPDGLGHGAPLEARGVAGAAAAAQPAAPMISSRTSVERHLGEDLAQGLIAAVGDVVIEALGIDEAEVLRGDPDLLLEEGALRLSLRVRADRGHGGDDGLHGSGVTCSKSWPLCAISTRGPAAQRPRQPTRLTRTPWPSLRSSARRAVICSDRPDMQLAASQTRTVARAWLSSMVLLRCRAGAATAAGSVTSPPVLRSALRAGTCPASRRRP